MNCKISDFKLAEYVIRKICDSKNVVFSDVTISFEDDIEGTLKIGKTKNVSHTIFRIVGEYITNSVEITGIQFFLDDEDKDNFLIALASNLRTFIYGDDISENFIEEPHILRLYQYPLVWILLKDIICPIYNKELVNLKVICDANPCFDIAKYYDEESIPFKDLSEEPFIFANIVNNRVVQSAFIFIEALKSYDLSPIEVIKNIYDTDLYDKYHGLLEIALDEEEVSDFECAIMANMGISFYGLISKKAMCLNPKFVKFAQNSVPGLPNQFWQLGVLERMMEPARGADWSVYKGLEPYVKEFWDKVEDVRKKRVENGHDSGVPFDVLLRIKSKQTTGYETDPTQTIQSLLSSDRVW